MTCPLAKFTKLPYNASDQRLKNLLNFIHIDTWGSCRVSTKGRYKYFLTIVDNYSRMTVVNLMVEKYDAFKIIEKFGELT